MGDKTGIEWTDATWNPLRGCTAVSPGCKNCYAASVAARFSGPGMPYEGLAYRDANGRPQWTGKVSVVNDHMGDPLRWKKPRRIFVNSMSDLFHDELSNEDIAVIFAIMAAAPQHTFQVLTKRPERMAAWFRWAANHPHRDGTPSGGPFAAIGEAICNYQGGLPKPYHEDTDLDCLAGLDWPLPNVWLGTSIEDQRRANERLPHLFRTPARVRFVSAEPLLGPIDLGDPEDVAGHLGWLIAGGESGHGARPMDLAWARGLRDQCQEALVAFFFKQLGANAATTTKKGGDLEEIPEDLRIREFPGARA